MQLRHRYGTVKDVLVREGIAVRGNCCKCPFHEDKSPSLWIYAGGTRWKCYVCDIWGDVIDLMAHLKGTDVKSLLRDEIGAPSTDMIRAAIKSPKERIENIQELPNWEQIESWQMSMLDVDLSFISQDRGISKDTILDMKIGMDGNRFMVPVWDMNGQVRDVRYWVPGRKIMSRKGADSYLYGLQTIARPDPVIICAGEWDMMAAYDSKWPGPCLAVPGEGKWHPEWSGWLIEREVVICFDRDDPGRNGALKTKECLKDVASGVHIWDWGPGDDGWDLRDAVQKAGFDPLDILHICST